MGACVRCGSRLEPTARFCAACGTRVSTASVPAATGPSDSVDPLAATVLGAPAAPASLTPGAAITMPVGTRVLVRWADGNRYPGTVQRAAGDYRLVLFPDGQQRWISVQYLSAP